MYQSGDAIGGTFPVVDPTTSGLSAADALPVGVISVNGVDGPAVTVTETATIGRYKWTVTLPAGIEDGDALAVWITAIVDGIAGGNNVWQGVGCTKRPVDALSAQQIRDAQKLAPSAGAAADDSVDDKLDLLAELVSQLEVVPTASVEVAPIAGTLTIRRGDAYSVTISNLQHLAGRTYLWWTVKSFPERQTDAQAKIQITEADGLTRLNGAEYSTAAHGALTVDDEAGTVGIALLEFATVELSVGQRWYWDLQILDADGRPLTIAQSTVDVVVDTTRAIAEPEPEPEE